MIIIICIYLYPTCANSKPYRLKGFFFWRDMLAAKQKTPENGWLPEQVEHFDQLAVRDPGAEGSGRYHHNKTRTSLKDWKVANKQHHSTMQVLKTFGMFSIRINNGLNLIKHHFFIRLSMRQSSLKMSENSTWESSLKWFTLAMEIWWFNWNFHWYGCFRK